MTYPAVMSMTVDTVAVPLLAPYRAVRRALETYAAPPFDLAVRLWIGLVFFRSGLEKAGDWQSTLFLFQEEYRLPLLPPNAAAALGMGAELVLPLFLFVGLAARLAALPLIVLTLTIQFVLGAADPAYSSTEHYYWLFLLGLIVVRGPGALSLDRLIARRFAA
jgi:putative oxidoreductase